MAKYIECEAAYRFAQDQLKKETGAYSNGWNHAMNVMKGALHNNDALPAADVVPVRHGRWIDFKWKSLTTFSCECNQCGITITTIMNYKFCPNCGAKMDKDGDRE